MSAYELMERNDKLRCDRRREREGSKLIQAAGAANHQVIIFHYIPFDSHVLLSILLFSRI